MVAKISKLLPVALGAESGGLEVLDASPRMLTNPAMRLLADVPPEIDWFNNLDNPRTRRAYKIDLQDFMSFVGIARPEEFRLVTRSMILAWRAWGPGSNGTGKSVKPSALPMAVSTFHACFAF